MRFQPRMSSAKVRLKLSFPRGWMKQHSMLHRQMITLGRGLVIFGGLRVYW